MPGRVHEMKTLSLKPLLFGEKNKYLWESLIAEHRANICMPIANLQLLKVLDHLPSQRTLGFNKILVQPLQVCLEISRKAFHKV